MFTDRFIKIPIILYNKKDAELMGYNHSTKAVETFYRLNPFEISHYRPCSDDNYEMNSTMIYTKSGDNFEADIEIKEFEKILNKLVL